MPHGKAVPLALSDIERGQLEDWYGDTRRRKRWRCARASYCWPAMA
jgi:hypothetical protein